MRVQKGRIYYVYMNTTKVIFNIPTAVKNAATKRAKHDRITLTSFLNAATQAYVEGEIELSHPELRATAKAIARIKKISADADKGKNVSGPFTLTESQQHLRNLIR